MQLTAHIDISTQEGLRIAKELTKYPNEVIIEMPIPDSKLYGLDEVFDNTLAEMREHYGEKFAKDYEKDFKERK